MKHPRNEHIEFDEENHRYFYKGDQEFDGVTSWIRDFCEPFEADKIAKYIAYRDGREKQDVLDEWEDKRQYGNKVDDLVESYVAGNFDQIDIDKFPAELQQFCEAMTEMSLLPVSSQWVIYDEDVERASAIDVLAKNKDGKYVVIDVKTMEKDISFDAYKDKTMSHPLDELPDSKYFKYCLQIEIYRDWLERKYDLDVSPVNYILRIRPSFYEAIPVIDMKQQINKLYSWK